jgi:hypothetical protein
MFLAACYAQDAAAQSRPFVNISTRAEVLNGQKVVVAGFIIQTTATTTKQVLIRGIGPSLGMSGTLADPTLELHGPNGLIHSNNNWGDTQYSAIAATGMPPRNGYESAILWTLPPGSYSVILAGNNGGTGVGMVEVYDMGGPAPMVNLSSRAQVGTGDNVLIGGVYVLDSSRAVVRAIGPTLANFGIQDALADPMLELYNAQGAQIASNDNWQSNPQWADIPAALRPSNGVESAILPTLAPGPYTVIVKGVSNGTGVGMVELYALADAKYPRVFQAWGDADNLNEDREVTVARHDLLWHVDFAFGYNWVDGNGQTTSDYTSETISQNGPIYYSIPNLRSRNPNMKILVQVAHYGMENGRLPSNHQWWKRDANGNRIVAWPGTTTYRLNQDDPTLRAHVANQARVLMETGQFDGIMLDTCLPGTSYLLPLFTAVRNAIGGNALIIANSNANKLSSSELNQINGVFMETGTPNTAAAWQNVKSALDWNEIYTRAPKVNCLESWYVTSRDNLNDLKRMRSLTALGLTHSNGYVLFSDPNNLPSNHLHNWYDFWSDHRLGIPTGTSWYTVSGYGHRRDFQNGSAVYNQFGNPQITVYFPEMRTSLATGQTGTSFILPGGDGGIYIKNQ